MTDDQPKVKDSGLELNFDEKWMIVCRIVEYLLNVLVMRIYGGPKKCMKLTFFGIGVYSNLGTSILFVHRKCSDSLPVKIVNKKPFCWRISCKVWYTLQQNLVTVQGRKPADCDIHCKL